MANLQEVERLLDQMTAGEKTLVLQRVVHNLGILAPGSKATRRFAAANLVSFVPGFPFGSSSNCSGWE